MKFETLTVTRAEQNCSVLWCEATQRAAVIDPGGDVDQILWLLELEGLTLDVVLATHGHFDHAGAVAELAAVASARIEGPHRDEAEVIDRLPEQGRRFRQRAAAFTPDRWLDDGDVVRFGEEALEVLHCPGHTRGHVAYFHRASDTAFVGDILFRGAIGAWEHPGGSLPDLITSIRSKLFALGDEVRFQPGHGEMSTFGHERRTNPFVGDEALARWRQGRMDREAAARRL